MKRGERSSFLLASCKAYGATGSPMGGIPPNTSLLFDIELIGWESGDGSATAGVASDEGDENDGDPSRSNDDGDDDDGNNRKHPPNKGPASSVRRTRIDPTANSTTHRRNVGTGKKVHDSVSITLISVVAVVGMVMAMFAARLF